MKISDTLLLIQTLPENVQQQKKVQQLRNELEKKEKDHDFMRQIKKHNSLIENQQDALLYYSKDYIGDQEYKYMEQLENQFIEINRKIRELLSISLKEIIGNDIEL